MGKQEWWTDVIPTPQLRCIIVNAHGIAKQKYTYQTMAGLVSDLFGVGHTHATSLCERCSIDPDRQATLVIRVADMTARGREGV